MVGVFAGLKLRLLVGALRSPASAVGLAIGSLFGAGIALVVCLSLVGAAGSGNGPEAAVLTATVLGVGWVVGPILAAASDDTLDADRLTLLPLRRRELATGLLAATAIGVGPVLSAVVTVVLTAASVRSPAGALAALVTAPLLLVLLLAASRAMTAIAATLVRGRRGRDLTVVVGALAGLLPALVATVGLPLLQDEQDRARLAGWAEWTPWGALAAVPGRIAGEPLQAAGGVAYAVLVLLAATAVWLHRLERLLTTPDRSDQPASTRRRRALLQPRTRRGACCVRELRAVRRDARRLTGYLSSVALLVVWVLLFEAGDPPAGAAYFALTTTTFCILQTANSYGFDGNAYWLELVTEASLQDCRDDLDGRALASVAITLPATAVPALALTAMTGEWGLLPGVVGVALALVGLLLGAALLLSILVPVPMPEKQRNPFSAGDPGRGFLATIGTLATLLAVSVALLPLAVPALVWPDRPAVQVGVLLAGAAYAVLGFALLRALAARRLHAAGPELLQVLSDAPR